MDGKIHEDWFAFALHYQQGFFLMIHAGVATQGKQFPHYTPKNHPRA